MRVINPMRLVEPSYRVAERSVAARAHVDVDHRGLALALSAVGVVPDAAQHALGLQRCGPLRRVWRFRQVGSPGFILYNSYTVINKKTHIYSPINIYT